jgi:F-type H+-transporting ATPase subunit b
MAAETPNHAETAGADHGAHASTGTTEVAAHGGGESGGLPQFRMEYWGGQIVWLFLIFAVLYILLAKVFVPRLRQIKDNRAATIADAVNQARSVQAEAEAQAKAAQAEIDEARSRARGLAVEAKAKAAAQLATSQKAEDERLQAQMDEAETRIRGLRDQAMSNVRGIAGETAQAMVEKLTGQKVTAAEIDAALTARAQGAA